MANLASIAVITFAVFFTSIAEVSNFPQSLLLCAFKCDADRLNQTQGYVAMVSQQMVLIQFCKISIILKKKYHTVVSDRSARASDLV